MKIFFDTEFTGLVPNTTLISLGCVAETGEKFYAGFIDYNKNLVNDWIQENVINNLYLGSCKDPIISIWTIKDDDLWTITGKSLAIRNKLVKWLKYLMNKYGSQRIQFVADVCHYDFTLLCNLFGGAFSLPEYVNPVCYDICQDLTMIDQDTLRDIWDVEADEDKMYWAFDISREELCKKLTGKLPEGEKHNVLYNAMVTKAIYEGMR